MSLSKALQQLRGFSNVPLLVLGQQGSEAEEGDSSGLVNKYVQRLRQKLGDTAQNPSWIASVHGAGYRFVGPRPEFLEVDEPAMSLTS